MSFYDQKFCFPLRILENDRLKLIPFDPAIHAPLFFEQAIHHPEVWEYIPNGPFPTAGSFISEFFEKTVLPDPGFAFFAIFDKTKLASNGEPRIAGITSYLLTSDVQLKTEIGYIVILPEFQRTHVTSNMVGLMLHYALDLPEQGGLGLRRVQWQANALNEPSVRTAKRLGFQMEGVLRWDRVLPEGKLPGKTELRRGDPRANCTGRHTTILSLCWDDWELSGGKEKIDKIMARMS